MTRSWIERTETIWKPITVATVIGSIGYFGFGDRNETAILTWFGATIGTIAVVLGRVQD